MRYNFSADFLRVAPPDTTFGDAWESLCFALLSAEYPATHLQRIHAPDGGVDIHAPSIPRAYQCKACEQGANGTADAASATGSLLAALAGRENLPWQEYHLATNANFTASGLAKVKEPLVPHSLPADCLTFLGPEYWHGLCVKHSGLVEDRFYYRVTLDELHVIKALQQARYFESFVAEARQKLKDSPITLRITCNRIHLEFCLPFSTELTVGHLVNVCQSVYGMKLDWVSFSDLSTSVGPSVSITRGNSAIPFEKKIGELITAGDNHFEFWIKIVWKDGIIEDNDSSGRTLRLMTSDRLIEAATGQMPKHERRNLTIARYEEHVQSMMWQSPYAQPNRSV